ncbi:MAG: hypothetical protein IH614_04190 [Desulfuromonadales bacterium]|nr:hypothetical protein [Desulfuromonadales bacterium]
MITRQLVTTFHHVVSQQTGNDISIGRAKTMLALAALTWPPLGLVITPHFFSSQRVAWKSDAFEALSIGGTFRRDPVGEDAAIILDNVEPTRLFLDQMGQCAAFIPLFGRQRLQRFNLTLARIYQQRAQGTALPLPGREARQLFPCETEYRHLFDWLVEHGIISAGGEWQSAAG